MNQQTAPSAEIAQKRPYKCKGLYRKVAFDIDNHKATTTVTYLDVTVIKGAVRLFKKIDADLKRVDFHLPRLDGEPVHSWNKAATAQPVKRGAHKKQ